MKFHSTNSWHVTIIIVCNNFMRGAVAILIFDDYFTHDKLNWYD